jgi:hypothetical protein
MAKRITKKVSVNKKVKRKTAATAKVAVIQTKPAKVLKKFNPIMLAGLVKIATATITTPQPVAKISKAPAKKKAKYWAGTSGMFDYGIHAFLQKATVSEICSLFEEYSDSWALKTEDDIPVSFQLEFSVEFKGKKFRIKAEYEWLPDFTDEEVYEADDAGIELDFDERGEHLSIDRDESFENLMELTGDTFTRRMRNLADEIKRLIIDGSYGKDTDETKTLKILLSGHAEFDFTKYY